jgi:hypothetical protein
MNRWPLVAVLTASALCALGGTALAQETAEPVRQFAAASEGLEEMKYRHLWLAYAFIWLLIMVLVARTAKRQAALAQDLQSLSARVEEMEKTRE